MNNMRQQPPSTEPFHIAVRDVVARRQEAHWGERLLADGRNLAVLIYDRPGGTNDRHIHPGFNEFWIVMQGELIWELGDYPPIHARKGDVVLSPGGTPHFIRTVGNEPSLRLGVTHPESNHDVKGERSRRLVPFPDQALPPNLLHTSLDDMLARFGEPPWVEAIIHDDRNRANLICHGPGMSSNAHWHPDFDEWWTVHRGELVWDVGSNRPPIHAQEGDIVFVPEGMRHRIHTVGHETSVRLAVTTPEMPHIYTDDDKTAPAPRE